jgi:phage-related protein
MKVQPSSIAIELHKLATDGALLCLLEIPEYTIYLARNIEDVIWNGKTFQKFWFELELINENTSGNVAGLTIQASNIGGFLENEIISHDNFNDSTCILYWVNSNCLSETESIFTISYDIIKVICTNTIVSLYLSAENPLLLNYPSWVFHSNICQYKDKVTIAIPWGDDDIRGHGGFDYVQYRGFKGRLCGYIGIDTSCNRTITDCLSKGNQFRFGGQLGLKNKLQDDEDV